MTSEARASASPPPEAAPAAKGEKKDKTEIDTKAADEVKSDVGEATAANEAQDNVENSGDDSKEMENKLSSDDAPGADTPAGNKKTGSAKKAGNTPNGNSARSKKGKRKSSIGIPEHRSRKITKKKSQLLTHVDAQPGDHFLARLKGHPLWPVIVADEDMLPDALRNTRGVATKRPDGTYREDYADNGKRVNERVFPVMFLETNEFAWLPNTDLVNSSFNAENIPKKAKADLEAAYKIAAEHHGLDYFKKLLKDHEDTLQAEEQAAEKKKGKAKRKSKGAEPDEDVEMEDADDMDVDEDEEDEDVEEKKPKSKKRKKAADSDDEDEKPAKTPKRKASTKTTTPKLKLTEPKTPNGTSKSATKTATKSATKSGGKSTGKSLGKSAGKSSAKTSKAKGAKKSAAKVESEEEEEQEDEEMADAPEKGDETAATMAEQQERRQKELLFLRHKLQRGLLMRDAPPPDEEMKAMSDFILKLESYADLESSIIRTTKINKVLKGIIKLTSIPMDEEFKFRERCKVLLQKWNLILLADPETPAAGEGGKETADVNGVEKAEKSEEEKAKNVEEAMEEEKADKVEKAADKEDETADKEDEVKKAQEEIEAAADEEDKVADAAKDEPKVEADEEETAAAETATEAVEAAA